MLLLTKFFADTVFMYLFTKIIILTCYFNVSKDVYIVVLC